jgi:hypothetical protein
MLDLPDRITGFLLGVFAGEGHIGGDGKQPQLTLRMHVRHQELFELVVRWLPGGRLYGPYHHGGRSYYQWMARGSYLRDEIAPWLHANRDLLDRPMRERFEEVCALYRITV